MQLRIVIYLYILLTPVGNLLAQVSAPEKENRILVILDGSAGTLLPWSEGKNKFQAATRFTGDLIDSVYNTNDLVAFSLRIYGSEFSLNEHNCFDSKQEVAFSNDNRAQMTLRLENLYARGTANIGYALKEAASDLKQTQLYNYYIVIVTAGEEGCENDLCNIISKYTLARPPYVISLTAQSALKEKYACLGNYFTATKESDLLPIIDTIRNQFKRSRRIIPDEETPRPTTSSNGSKQWTVERIDKDDENFYTTLFFTSKYKVGDIDLNYQQPDGSYKPAVSSTVFVVPMPRKKRVRTGRYRVIYIIEENGRQVSRTKEFFARDHFDNVVDLD